MAAFEDHVRSLGLIGESYSSNGLIRYNNVNEEGVFREYVNGIENFDPSAKETLDGNLKYNDCMSKTGQFDNSVSGTIAIFQDNCDDEDNSNCPLKLGYFYKKPEMKDVYIAEPLYVERTYTKTLEENTEVIRLLFKLEVECYNSKNHDDSVYHGHVRVHFCQLPTQ